MLVLHDGVGEVRGGPAFHHSPLLGQDRQPRQVGQMAWSRPQELMLPCKNLGPGFHLSTVPSTSRQQEHDDLQF